MAELHIDSDWKKQAQEEKKRLAEEEAKRKAAQPAAAVPSAGASSAGGPAPRGAAGRGAAREMPPASFETLIQSIVTQALYYLGDIASRGGEPVLNLDLARHQVDTLAVIEEKTRGNLSPEEKKNLDAALYEVRMRFVAVATQFATYP